MTNNEYDVHILRCGSCGHVVTTRHAERSKAAMLEHLVYVHSGVAS